MKEHTGILILLGLAAAAVIIYLMRQSPAAPAVTDNSSAAPAYPNSAPIQMGNIEIGGSPLNLTYNYPPQIPTVEVKPDESLQGCECSHGQNYCESPGVAVTIQKVPEKILKGAIDNFQAYQAKPTSYTGTITKSQSSVTGTLKTLGVDVKAA